MLRAAVGNLSITLEKLAMRFFLQFRNWLSLALIGLTLGASAASAADLVLADGRIFPGQLWHSRAGSPERLLLRREAQPNAAYPQAVMKLAQVAVGPDDKIYYASGLDGYVFHLLDDRNEVLSFEFPGQVRDLACGDEPHTVYFSVVPTPQNGEPLADGKIYRRDLWAGQPTEIATVRQHEVGGNWWGAIAVRGDFIYLAPFEDPSRVFNLPSNGPEQIGTSAGFRIHGFNAARDGSFYLADGTSNIARTTDFQSFASVFRGERPFTGVAVLTPRPLNTNEPAK